MIEGLEPDTKGTMDSLVDLAEQLQTKIINEDVVAMDVQAKMEGSAPETIPRRRSD